MSAPIFLWDPILSQAWPHSTDQADEYRIKLRGVGHDHSPRVDHFAELLKAKVAAEKTFDEDFKQQGYLETAYLFRPQHTAALISWDYFKDAYADLFFVLMVEAAREAGLLIYDTRSEWVFLPDGNMLPHQAARAWDKHAKAVKAKFKKGFNVATDMPSTDAQCEKLMRSVMLEPLMALGFTEQVLKYNHLRDREYKAFILEVNGFRLEYKMYSFMKKVWEMNKLELLPNYHDVVDVSHQDIYIFSQKKITENSDGRLHPEMRFDFSRQFCRVYPAGHIHSEALHFRTRHEINFYLQQLIQAIQQLVSQCTSLSQLHHYIHHDENNLFKTQIMYPDYPNAPFSSYQFVYNLANYCEDATGFAQLISRIRSAFLQVAANCYGEDSSEYVSCVAAYDTQVAECDARYRLSLEHASKHELGDGSSTDEMN